MLFGLGVGVLVYIAFVFDLFGFMARDELWLRLLMLAASALYLVYYFIVAGTPLWDALITNGALALVNLAIIAVIVTERTTLGFSPEDAALSRLFPLLRPGQFRRLLKAGRRVSAPAGAASRYRPRCRGSAHRRRAPRTSRWSPRRRYC